MRIPLLASFPLALLSISALAQDVRTYVENMQLIAKSYAWMSIYEYDRSDPAVQMLIKLRETDQKVITCEYPSIDVNGRKGYTWIGFWYDKPPPNIADIRAIDKKGKLRYMGTRAIKVCPEDEDDAMALRKKNMAETGFPAR